MKDPVILTSFDLKYLLRSKKKAMQALWQADFQGVQSVLRNFYQDFIIMYGKSTEENWNIFQKQLEDI